MEGNKMDRKTWLSGSVGLIVLFGSCCEVWQRSCF